MILAAILSSISLLGAHQGPAQIYCKLVVSDSDGVIRSPAVRDLNGEKASIESDSATSHLRFEITPTLKDDGKIHNKLHVKISERNSRHSDGEDSEESHSSDLKFVYAATPGMQTRFVIGQNGLKMLKGKQKAHLAKGEFELDLILSIPPSG